jgi:hypothetical protein
MVAKAGLFCGFWVGTTVEKISGVCLGELARKAAWHYSHRLAGVVGHLLEPPFVRTWDRATSGHAKLFLTSVETQS